MMFTTLMLFFGAHSLEPEECHENLNADMMSMLQVVQKDVFCPEFYKEEDLDTATQGLVQAKVKFMEYCNSNAPGDIDCEMIAADVFDDAESLDEELCNKVMMAKVMFSGDHPNPQFLETHETTNQVDCPGHRRRYSCHARRRRSLLPFTYTDPLSNAALTGATAAPGNVGNVDRNRWSSMYAGTSRVVRIASVRYRRPYHRYTTSGYDECIEMGCQRGWFSRCIEQLHSLLDDRDVISYAMDRMDNHEGRACGPYYDSYHSGHLYGQTSTTYSYAAIYRHYSIPHGQPPSDDRFRNRWNPFQENDETDTRLLAITFTVNGEHRCAEMGTAPTNDDAYERSINWLGNRFRDGGGDNVVRYPNVNNGVSGANGLGFACGPWYNQYLQSYYFANDAHVVVWRNT